MMSKPLTSFLKGVLAQFQFSFLFSCLVALYSMKIPRTMKTAGVKNML